MKFSTRTAPYRPNSAALPSAPRRAFVERCREIVEEAGASYLSMGHTRFISPENQSANKPNYLTKEEAGEKLVRALRNEPRGDGRIYPREEGEDSDDDDADTGAEGASGNVLNTLTALPFIKNTFGGNLFAKKKRKDHRLTRAELCNLALMFYWNHADQMAAGSTFEELPDKYEHRKLKSLTPRELLWFLWRLPFRSMYRGELSRLRREFEDVVNVFKGLVSNMLDISSDDAVAIRRDAIKLTDMQEQTDNKLDMDEYLKQRLLTHLKIAHADARRYDLCLRAIQLSVILLSSSIVVLHSRRAGIWVPFIIAVVAVFEFLKDWFSIEQRLAATNASAVALTRAYMYWQGLNKIRKKMPGEKDNLVSAVETAITTWEIGETQQMLANLKAAAPPEGDAEEGQAAATTSAAKKGA